MKSLAKLLRTRRLIDTVCCILLALGLMLNTVFPDAYAIAYRNITGNSLQAQTSNYSRSYRTYPLTSPLSLPDGTSDLQTEEMMSGEET